GVPRSGRPTDDAERRLIRKGYRIAWWARHFSGRPRDDAHAMEVDHVVPRSRGGSARLSNLQLITRRDNQLKGNRLPE
ncbi:MAG: HNH endonuclease signature motif containing protein, partial [Planctomycetota bacterium]|nr:HNH endonuclease signature motif containing protein [Planctomycetota bacterium]